MDISEPFCPATSSGRTKAKESASSAATQARNKRLLNICTPVGINADAKNFRSSMFANFLI
jgi:hypothetical protein